MVMKMMMTQQKKIDVAKDFSTEPYGRYLSDGDSNGTKFREDFVVPALAQNNQVIITLDGAEGYGSSFLEETFGGLVRENGFSPSQLRERLVIVSEEDPSLIAEIWEYVDTATPKTLSGS
jgi:hypothetical protein